MAKYSGLPFTLFVDEPVALGQQPFIRISCTEAGCQGCKNVHRRINGPVTYEIEGEPATEAAYQEFLHLMGVA